MNTFLKGLSMFGIVFCGIAAVGDVMSGNVGWAIVMVGCVLLNINTLRSCYKRD